MKTDYMDLKSISKMIHTIYIVALLCTVFLTSKADDNETAPTITLRPPTFASPNTTSNVIAPKESDIVSHFWLHLIITALGSILILMLCSIVICYYKHQYNKAKNKSHASYDRYISNALVAVIAIAHYDNDQNIDNVDVKNALLEDLPVDKDVENLRDLFGCLRYKFMPKNLKLHWTEQQLVSFLEHDIMEELFDENNELKYDALLVCVSSHGLKDYIVTSDYRQIEKTCIHRIVSLTNPKTREIPRIFLYDSCNGSAQRELIRPSTINFSHLKSKNTSKEISKKMSMSHFNQRRQWTYNTHSPDYQLVQVHAACLGFQAKADLRKGSLMLYKFTQKMMENTRKRLNKPLGVIFEEIQKELHDEGKQHTQHSFSDNTRNLHLKRNKVKGKNIDVANKPGLPTPVHYQKSNVDVCNECNEEKEGIVDQTDSKFYCVDCWKHYLEEAETTGFVSGDGFQH